MAQKQKRSPLPYIVGSVLVLGVALFVSDLMTSGANSPAARQIKIPQLSEVAQRGKVAFEENCAACHGINAAGTDSGPSFIDPIYRPAHHADQAFFLAPKRGVRAHHWHFGNMPALENPPDDRTLAEIVTYIRELQRANGIR